MGDLVQAGTMHRADLQTWATIPLFGVVSLGRGDLFRRLNASLGFPIHELKPQSEDRTAEGRSIGHTLPVREPARTGCGRTA